jgi:hypothetical protein
MLREAPELEAKALLVQPASELGQEGAALCEEIAAEGDRILLGERQLRRIFFWVSALTVTGFVNLVIMLLRLTSRIIWPWPKWLLIPWPLSPPGAFRWGTALMALEKALSCP